MLFKKKKKTEQEPVDFLENEVANEKETVADEEPEVIEMPKICGEKEKSIVFGYALKAFDMWNYNHPQDVISKEELEKLLIGLRMATTSMTTDKAIALYEEYSKKEG